MLNPTEGWSEKERDVARIPHGARLAPRSAPEQQGDALVHPVAYCDKTAKKRGCSEDTSTVISVLFGLMVLDDA